MQILLSFSDTCTFDPKTHYLCSASMLTSHLAAIARLSCCNCLKASRAISRHIRLLIAWLDSASNLSSAASIAALTLSMQSQSLTPCTLAVEDTDNIQSTGICQCYARIRIRVTTALSEVGLSPGQSFMFTFNASIIGMLQNQLLRENLLMLFLRL